MPDYIASNRALWNDWTLRHIESDHHRDVARFRETGSSLRSIEIAEIGEVAGKSLLHLQCNMGCDTLSWARRGARVTGVDLADDAIARGQALAAEAHLPARFIQADLYELPDALDDQFDIVCASYGALCWLPNLAGWARVVAALLRPGGIFHLVDMHPVGMMFTSSGAAPAGPSLQIAHPYFHGLEPTVEGDGRGNTVYVWNYTLGEVTTALLQVGLRLDYLHEFAHSFYQQFPELIRGVDEYWHWPAPSPNLPPPLPLPLLFSLRART